MSDGIIRDRLRCREDGTFTIVQFNDTQDGARADRRTIALQEAVLDEVRPDLALINGDVIDGSPTSALEAKQALNNVVLPMEDRSIPWTLTFGNHDEDSSAVTGMDEAAYVDFVRQYRHNLTTHGATGITGTGNQVLTVRSRGGERDAFAVWLLDSGRGALSRAAQRSRERTRSTSPTGSTTRTPPSVSTRARTRFGCIVERGTGSAGGGANGSSGSSIVRALPAGPRARPRRTRRASSPPRR